MSESDPRPFPVLDPATVEPRRGAAYPAHLRGPFAAREKRALGDPLGLTSFGVNLTRLPPGTASALRHWHSLEDEFVMVLQGEATLVTDGPVPQTISRADPFISELPMKAALVASATSGLSTPSSRACFSAG